jgi:transcriptional regulator with XRE-family HTH domain
MKPESLDRALGTLLRDVMAANGLSQREFAKRLGLSQSALSYLTLGGRRADGLGYYQRIAAVLGVSLSELIRQLETQIILRKR